jgi:hypothetical protein
MYVYRDSRNRFHKGTFMQLIGDEQENAQNLNSYIRVEEIVALELEWKETV